MDSIKKIRILKNGPYQVSGGIPLYEKAIRFNGKIYILAEIRFITDAPEYHLCRCGKTKKAPFCDASHLSIPFDGKETASKELYENRAMLFTGKAVNLMDDKRCAFARFCHQPHGIVWDIIEHSDNPDYIQEAIQGSNDCPTGRLTVIRKNGEKIEPVYDPVIDVVQDPYYGVSAGLFVRGDILIESAEGDAYENRSRNALCRCGQSKNKPFCDTNHIRSNFSDKS